MDKSTYRIGFLIVVAVGIAAVWLYGFQRQATDSSNSSDDQEILASPSSPQRVLPDSNDQVNPVETQSVSTTTQGPSGPVMLAANADFERRLRREIAGPKGAGAVARNFTDADIPRLIEILNNPDWLLDWPFIALILGHMGRTGESEVFLIDFVTRAESFEPHNRYEFMDAKFRALHALGLIGGDRSDEFLLEMYTFEGAQRHAEKWLYLDHGRDRDALVVDFIYNSAVALAYSRKPEHYSLLESTCIRTVAILRDRDLYDSLSEEEQRMTREIHDVSTEALAIADLEADIRNGSIQEFSPMEYLTMVSERLHYPFAFVILGEN